MTGFSLFSRSDHAKMQIRSPRNDQDSLFRSMQPSQFPTRITNQNYTFIHSVVKFTQLLVMFTWRDLHARYIGSTLGFFWSIIHPLLIMAMYLFVFSVVLKVKIGASGDTADYGLFLFAGMLFWFPLQEALERSTRVIFDNRSIVQKVNFPIVLLPLHIVCAAFIHMGIALLLFLGILLFMGHPLSLRLLWIMPVTLVHFFCTVGLSLLITSLNMFFRDITQLVKAITLIWFFATPIVYPGDMVPHGLRWILSLNPLTCFVALIRSLLLGNSMPGLSGVIFFILFSLGILYLGLWLFEKTAPEFTDLL